MNLELLDHPPKVADQPTDAETLRVGVYPLAFAWELPCVDEWRELFGRDENGYALQHPDVLFAECRQLTAPRHEPLWVECRQRGELIGAATLLPKAISLRQAGGFGPNIQLAGYRLAGGRCLLKNTDNETEDRLIAAALNAVGARRADFLVVEDLDQSSNLMHSIQRELPEGWASFAPHGFQARLRIRFPKQGADYWQQFSGKTRRGLRRKLKKCGETRLERITAAEEVPDFLTAAHRISLETWQTRRLGLRIRNDDAERAMLIALADAGLLRCYLWHLGGEPAAFCVGNQAHGVFHYEEVGYATRFSRVSPGQMLVVQMIDDLLSHDSPQWFDFGGGDADYKRMFANHSSQSGNVWMMPPSLKSRAALSWIHLCRGVRQTARKAVTALGLATRVRQWIRYGGRKNEVSASSESTEENSP